MSGYIRYHCYPMEEILPLIGLKTHSLWVPEHDVFIGIRLDSKRLLLLKQGTDCVCCGAEGDHFWLERSGCFEPHLNLYGINMHDHEVLMTCDHIIPRSKGGAHTLENIQLLCANCNNGKADKLLTIEQLKKRRRVS